MAVSTFNFYQQHNFTIGKGWSAEVSGWYSSPSIWEGTFRMNEMWSMGAGLSKKMADGRSKVTLSIDDIFKTNVWSGISEFGGLFMDVSGGWDSRRVRLTATYNFGRQINIKTRQRKSAFEEEQQRIKKG